MHELHLRKGMMLRFILRYGVQVGLVELPYHFAQVCSFLHVQLHVFCLNRQLLSVTCMKLSSPIKPTALYVRTFQVSFCQSTIHAASVVHAELLLTLLKHDAFSLSKSMALALALSLAHFLLSLTHIAVTHQLEIISLILHTFGMKFPFHGMIHTH